MTRGAGCTCPPGECHAAGAPGCYFGEAEAGDMLCSVCGSTFGACMETDAGCCDDCRNSGTFGRLRGDRDA